MDCANSLLEGFLHHHYRYHFHSEEKHDDKCLLRHTSFSSSPWVWLHDEKNVLATNSGKIYKTQRLYIYSVYRTWKDRDLVLYKKGILPEMDFDVATYCLVALIVWWCKKFTSFDCRQPKRDKISIGSNEVTLFYHFFIFYYFVIIPVALGAATIGPYYSKPVDL
ncbi:hypothetical protein ACJX0J_021417, partial [Zea mays]